MKQSKSPNRTSRKGIAEDTLRIVDRGWYESAAGDRREIAAAVEACLAGTRLFTPGQLAALEMSQRSPVETAGRRTKFAVTNETTLSAARRLCVQEGKHKALCLNFASAKNPGGGFLGGSSAQEESLARSSALYPSLVTQQEYYEANRREKSPLYTDHMILSPAVPIIRMDDGELLETPYQMDFLTAPAVNAGALANRAVKEQGRRRATMARRINYVIEVCLESGCSHLILGAWGCGVFRNDPVEIASLFAEALLRNPRYVNRFEMIVFAVLDTSEDGQIIRPFREQFSEAG